MNDALPWIFALGACAALGTALVALWASFRAAFGGSIPLELTSDLDHDARLRLVDEKEALLKNLSDLRFDHDAGKISDADFERLDGKLRERAKNVMRLLDADVEPFREEAERLLAEHLGRAPRDPYRVVAAEKRDEKRDESGGKKKSKASEEATTRREKKAVRDAALAESEAESPDATAEAKTETATDDAKAETAKAETETKSCPSCETDNDADAVFCKKCGHRFDAVEESASASAEEER